MHDYCFHPCMWPQVIDLFPSKQTRILWRTSTYLPSRAAWLLFPSMHVASGDRFVSFKAGGDRRDGSFFFYHTGYHTGWANGRTKTNVAPKDVRALFFLVVGDPCMIIVSFHAWLLFHSMHDYCFFPCVWPQVIDLFPSKQAGMAGMAVSFSIARGIARGGQTDEPKQMSHQKMSTLTSLARNPIKSKFSQA